MNEHSMTWLSDLESKEKKIKDWFETKWLKLTPPLYGSVDLRHAGFKIAPVDFNLFPAGFNNLDPLGIKYSVEAAKKIIEDHIGTKKNILLIPESHTRNLFYWKNIFTIQTILREAGYNLVIGALADFDFPHQTILLDTGEKITVDPIIRHQNNLSVNGFQADLIILNNDLSEGVPESLKNLSIPILPPPDMGWSKRLKSIYFKHYKILAEEFSKLIDWDPWLISPLFRYCVHVDFLKQNGLDCILSHAEQLLQAIQIKYDHYQIKHPPFLIIKADAGTYGMAVMTVRNLNELRALNRKQRSKMSNSKGGQPVHRVIIQEGIYTFERLGKENTVAEPVIYLWGKKPVGGFYRMHAARKHDENLNAPGMQFQAIDCYASHNKQYLLYRTMAELSMLAAATETKEAANDA